MSLCILEGRDRQREIETDRQREGGSERKRERKREREKGIKSPTLSAIQNKTKQKTFFEKSTNNKYSKGTWKAINF